MTKTALLVAIVFMGSNFLYQEFNGHNWVVAFERSYFQATIVVVIAFVLWLYPKQSR